MSGWVVSAGWYEKEIEGFNHLECLMHEGDTIVAYFYAIHGGYESHTRRQRILSKRVKFKETHGKNEEERLRT